MTERSIDALVKHLRQCCTRVDGARPGTGFFITSDVIVTCAHVIGSLDLGSIVSTRLWNGDGSPGEAICATVMGVFTDDDLAFLRTEKAHPFVAVLGDELTIGDQLVGIGFPQREAAEERDTFLATYEGQTEFVRVGRIVGSELKFQAAQVEPGFSGGPILNLRTCRVIGVTVATRDRTRALGGWAISISTLRLRARELEVELPANETAWDKYADLNKSTYIGVAQVPPFPTHYVDRPDALREVLERLFSEQPSAGFVIGAIHGLGGIGKSTLAVAAARSEQTLHRCPDGVLWVSLGQEPQLIPLLSSWLEVLGAGAPAYWSVEAATALLRTTLQNRALLLVIDDVWEAHHAKVFMVGGARCRVLLTTRRTAVSDSLGADTWLLEAMNPDESVQLMTRRARSPFLDQDSRSRAKRLADRLGNLPLAVELVGALLNRNISLTHIDSQISALVNRSATRASSVSAAIDACLQLSLKYLKRQDSEAWRNFLLLALGRPGSEIYAEVCSSIWAISKDEAESLLSQFADEAMISRTIHGFRLHELMQTAALRVIEFKTPDGLGLSSQEAYGVIIDNMRRSAPGGQWNQLPFQNRLHSQLIWYLIKAAKFTELEHLLSHTTSEGRNAWYVGCEARGEIAGFANDLLLAISAIVVGSPTRVDLQLRFALMIASLNSAYSHLTEEILRALVSGGAWSVAEAFHWCRAFVGSARQPYYLIALLEGIEDHRSWSAVDTELTDYIAHAAFNDAKDLLVDLSPNKTTAGLLGRLISTCLPDKQKEELESFLKFFKTPDEKIALIKNIDKQVLGSIPFDIFTEIRSKSIGADQIRQLLSLLKQMNAENLVEVSEFTLDQIELLLPASDTVGTDSSTESAISGDNSTRAEHEPTARSSFSGKKDDTDAIVDENVSINLQLHHVEPEAETGESIRLQLPYYAAPDSREVRSARENQFPEHPEITEGNRSGIQPLDLVSYDLLKQSYNEEIHPLSFSTNIDASNTQSSFNSIDEDSTNPDQTKFELIDRHWHESSFIGEIESAIIYLPDSAVFRLKTLVDRIPAELAKLTLQNSIAKTINLIEMTPQFEENDGISSQNRRLTSGSELADSFEKFSSGHIQEALGIFRAYVASFQDYLVDEICITWIPYWRRLDPDTRQLSAQVLAERNTKAVGPMAMLAASRQCSPREIRNIVSAFKSTARYRLPIASIICVSVGIRELADAIIIREMPIDDVNQQAAAVYALMPYLPRDFPRELLSRWRREGPANHQISSLTDMMSELVRALDVDHLPEVLEAASKMHSEWWVVEACTLMLRRLEKQEEFKALIRASRSIINSDLRVRLVGRVAQRAAEFEHWRFALDVILALPPGPLRSDELHNLAMTFACLGQTAATLEAADEIPNIEFRDKTLVQCAMEFCAQHKVLDAERLICAVRSKRWLAHGMDFIAAAKQFAKPPGSYDVALARLRSRQDDIGPATATLLAQVPDKLRSMELTLSSIEAVLQAIQSGDSRNFKHAAQAFWTEPQSSSVYVSTILARKTRAEVLADLKVLAPLLAIEENGAVVSGTIAAIGDVGGWWP